MRFNAGCTGGGRAFTLPVLMVAVFTVSVGYGVVLPRLPRLIERLLGPGVEAAQVSWHTGLLTAVYTASLFLFAPLWGRLADRRGPRGVLLLGLLGFGATMLVFSFVESLIAGYAERFLSGVFAAAVTPVAAAVAGSLTTTEQGRARRLAFVSMASIAGFMLGPMLGVIIAPFAEEFLTFAIPAQSIGIPLAVTALLAFSVASAIVFAVPSSEGRDRLQEIKGASLDKSAWLLPKLLILTFIVSAGVGAFEVGPVSVGLGVVLRLLPYLIERLLGTGAEAFVLSLRLPHLLAPRNLGVSTVANVARSLRKPSRRRVLRADSL